MRVTFPLLLLIGPQPAAAQGNPWSDALLPRARAALRMVPGASPTAVRVFRFGRMQLKESYLLDHGEDRLLPATYTVFQIRFPTGWIMVDAGMDPEVAGDTTARFRSEYGLVEQALLGARSIVVTHEHHDHAGGVVRSPALSALVPKTLLTRAQARTLQERPNVPLIRIDSAAAALYPLVDYELLLPIAPGVVLIRAPGHTPGSQMVFVRLASGRELLLIGDIAWHMDGIEQRRQKPESESTNMNEDRGALQAEIDWLHDLSKRTSVTLVNGHDDRWLGQLIARGALLEGLDLSRP